MDRAPRVAVLALVALVVVAGCTAPSTTPATDATTSTTSTTSTADAGGGSTLAPGEGVTVTVTRVVDGDTLDVRFPNGTEDTVRLIGVDTPEVRSTNVPGEYPGVPDTETGADCLREAGHAASDYTATRVADREVTLRFDPNLERRGYYGRLLAYVVVDGASLNYDLVESGHARVYESAFAERDRYEAAMAAAREAGRGLWSCATDGGDATGGVRIATIHADAAGNDNENLNDEYVTLENAGDEAVDLSGWTVSDEAGKTYTVPEGVTLAPGDRITLHTGSGTDSATDLYWGQSRAVWNNGGDTVTVRDASGAVVAERSY